MMDMGGGYPVAAGRASPSQATGLSHWTGLHADLIRRIRSHFLSPLSATPLGGSRRRGVCFYGGRLSGGEGAVNRMVDCPERMLGKA